VAGQRLEVENLLARGRERSETLGLARAGQACEHDERTVDGAPRDRTETTRTRVHATEQNGPPGRTPSAQILF
jgi:hypothetical protein